MTTENNPFNDAPLDSAFDIGGNSDEEFNINEVVSLPPQGEWVPCTITNVEYTTAKSGNHMFVWTVSPQANAVWAEKMYKDYTVTQGGGLFKLARWAKALGDIGEIKDGKVSLRFKKQDVVGRDIHIKFKHEEYQGMPSAKIDNVQAYDGPVSPNL